jgi:hypothetical protein
MKTKMKKEQIFGIIRHTLTFVGGLLFYNGVLDDSEATEIVSATMTLIGLIWSIVEKNKQ